METSSTGNAIYNISSGNIQVNLEEGDRVGDYATLTVEDRDQTTYTSLEEPYINVNSRKSQEEDNIQKRVNMITQALTKRIHVRTGVLTAVILLLVISVGIIVFLLVSSKSEGNFEAGGRCPQYTDIKNGNIVNTTGSNHGDVTEIECGERSKLIGSKLITCLSSGKWSATPKCMPKNCGDFVIPNNMILESETNDSVVGTEILVSCIEGFKLKGNKTIVYTFTESWSEIPACEAIDCGVPENISNSEVIGLFNSTYNNTLFVKCNKGFKLKGSNSIRCTKAGVWDTFPICDIVSCGLPEIPIHGSLSNITGTTYLATATIKCDDEFYLDGNSVIWCQAGGIWTEGATCEKNDDCIPGLCGSYGTCVDGVNSYTCLCATRFTGANCETSVIDCIPGLCGANGICVDGMNSYTCQCATGFTGTNCETRIFTDCFDVLNFGHQTKNGVYNITTWRNNQQIQVFCDMTTSGGGWTVFQKRYDGSVDFYRTFAEYESGFGDLQTEFWIGLKYIQEMAEQGTSEIRIDLQAADGTRAYETFSNFSLSNKSEYRLHIGTTTSSSNILDDRVREFHNEKAFTTKDRDLDESSGNCAVLWTGAWWYANCHKSNLNGQYLTPGIKSSWKGMVYDSFRFGESLKTSKMMLRRMK